MSQQLATNGASGTVSPKSTKVCLLAISGPSCSGKTTLARLLRDAIQNGTFIIHEDDFYLEDKDIPKKEVSPGVLLEDWDCIESLDLDGFLAQLMYIKETGRLGPGFESKEDKNSVGQVDLDFERIQHLGGMLREMVVRMPGCKVVIVDGFLLYPDAMAQIRDLFDVKLFLNSRYEVLKSRREARTGYVTLEAFWTDPPGYWDQIVWPNFVKDHAFLWEEGRSIKKDVVDKLGINVMPAIAEGNMTECFAWACRSLQEYLEEEA